MHHALRVYIGMEETRFSTITKKNPWIYHRHRNLSDNPGKENPMKATLKWLFILAFLAMSVAACTQETQNKIGRSIQNWTGTDGVLEIYAGDKLVRRFIDIDKLSTAYGTSDQNPRPYRFGYGVLDENFNNTRDSNEKKVYFEFSDYSTSYVFFESPN
jgi:hypothetical protein